MIWDQANKPWHVDYSKNITRTHFLPVSLGIMTTTPTTSSRSSPTVSPLQILWGRSMFHGLLSGGKIGPVVSADVVPSDACSTGHTRTLKSVPTFGGANGTRQARFLHILRNDFSPCLRHIALWFSWSILLYQDREQEWSLGWSGIQKHPKLNESLSSGLNGQGSAMFQITHPNVTCPPLGLVLLCVCVYCYSMADTQSSPRGSGKW